ncbi:MAG: sugar phosphate nucleotidyltransferase [Bacillota bacterium]|nr:sugar phosphate nucleotidyltransferase [Bacillota bacterium]
MKAIIMAGGQGTRLRPLTCNIPKPMMPIMGKPVMQYAIELLKNSGITEIGITLQYLPDEVMNYFGDGKELGVNLRYFIEEAPLGTAGSVKSAESFLDDTFIVISGDALTDIDLSRAIAFHKQNNSITTLVLKEVPVPLEYGVVVTDKDGRITGFLEKPSWGEVFSDKVNTGIYIMEPEVFTYYEKNQKFDFSNDLFPILLNNKRDMFGYISEGYWCDIGNIEQYVNCHFDILKGIVKVNIKGEKYKDGIWVGENCEISPEASIVPPVYIGANTKIYSNAEIGPYSVLGRNNILSSGTTIKRSILFNNCYIGSNVEVRGSVICNKVQIESKAGVFEESAIGDETLIGERTVIKPGVRIWPNKIIESSTTVKSNIIWGGKFSKSLFGKNGISGEVNVDITSEVVSKLGSAHGSLLKSGAKVAISCSDNGAAQMFKYSLATGLLSMGIEVYDLKRMTTAMTRQAVVFFGVSGGIHVVIDKEDPQKVNILFFDSNGLDIDKVTERKIENSFIREDYRRIKTDAFKKIIHLSDCIEYYSRQILNRIDVSKVRDEKFKIVVGTRNPMLKGVIEKVLKEIGVSIKFYGEPKDIVGLSKTVIECGANMGAYISDEGEEGIFIDEKGNIIKDEVYEALKALVLLKTTKIKVLAAPVTASANVEEIAKMCGAKFVRTKTSQKNILDAYLKNEKQLNKRDIVNGYLMTLDALSILLLTLNLMASSNLALSTIMSRVPRYYAKKQEIVCPWNLKGKVMRNLIEESFSNSIDLIEGVKLNFDDAWALILPDSDEPLCRVYTESKDSEVVQNLSAFLAKRIESITGIIGTESEKQA